MVVLKSCSAAKLLFSCDKEFQSILCTVCMTTTALFRNLPSTMDARILKSKLNTKTPMKWEEIGILYRIEKQKDSNPVYVHWCKLDAAVYVTSYWNKNIVESYFAYSWNDCKAVLPDVLDQLLLRKVLIAVILTTVNGAEVCNRA